MKVELLETYEKSRKAHGVEFFIWGEGYPKLLRFAPLRAAYEYNESNDVYTQSRPVPELVVRASQYVRRTRRRANAGFRNGV